MSAAENMMEPREQKSRMMNETADEQELRIDLLEIFYRLLEKAWIIALAAVAAAVMAGAVTHFFIPDSYTATAKLFVVGGEDAVIDLTQLNFGDKLADDYIQVFKNRDVYNTVRDGFPKVYGYELPFSFQDIKEQLTVTQLSNTRILKISFTCHSASTALNVVEAYLQTAQSFMATRMGTSLPDEAFESPYVPGTPSGPNTLRIVVLAFIIAALAATLAYVCVFILDDRIRTPEQLEKRLGLPTLGMVPVQEKSSRPSGKGGKA